MRGRDLAKWHIWVAIGFAGSTLCAQPYINTKGVVNAASFMPPDLPAGALAQGSIFAILGRELGPATAAAATALPLGLTVGGVGVKVFQGATSVNAIPLAVSASRIYAIMPSNAPLGRASVQVTVNGVASNPAPVTVAAAGFGFFTANSLDLSNPQGIGIPAAGAGFGPGFAQNTLDDGSQAPNSAAATAVPGQIVTVFGTGLGPIATPDSQAPGAGSPSTTVEVFVGGQPAAVSMSGRSVYPGIDQIAFTVPDGAPAGCYVPVQARVAGKGVSNAVTIAIDLDGNACADAATPLGATLAAGGKFGGVILARVSTEFDFGLAQTEVTADSVAGIFRSESGAAPYFNPLFSLPPAGTCTTYAASGYGGQNYILPALTASGQTLDAGAQLAIATPTGTVNATKLPGYPQAYLSVAGVGTNLPSSYLISGNGGVDVGPFAVTLSVPPSVTWTNRAQAVRIARATGLTITWDAGDSTDPVVIAGASRNTPVDSSAGFVCVAAAGDGSFAVPPYVLANLPATDAAGKNRAAVFVGSLPVSAMQPIATAGLDTGFAVAVAGSARNVTVQ